jgi:hypothetical protein
LAGTFKGESMNLYQKLVVVITDVLLIAEVCVSMYFAAKTPETLTSVFMKSFFIMCIPTLIIAKISISRLSSCTSPDTDMPDVKKVENSEFDILS